VFFSTDTTKYCNIFTCSARKRCESDSACERGIPRERLVESETCLIDEAKRCIEDNESGGSDVAARRVIAFAIVQLWRDISFGNPKEDP